MGYESRIYIVKKCNRVDQVYDKRYAEILMRIDLGKVTVETEKLLKKRNVTDCFIYKDDGNTVVLEDECGDPLREMSLSQLYIILHTEMRRRGKDYAGYPIMDALVNGALPRLIKKYGYNSDKVVCLHYGY